MRSALATLNAAKVNLDYTNIISPVDGTVVSRNVTQGQTVAASFQTPTLFLIATDLTQMQVDTNVSESDIGSVVTGNNVLFTVEAYPDQTFTGTVTQVRQAPQSVQNVITYDAVVGVPNPQLLLKPGMTAAVRIVIARAQRRAARSESGVAIYAARSRAKQRGGRRPTKASGRRREEAAAGPCGVETRGRPAGARAGRNRSRRRRVHRNRRRCAHVGRHDHRRASARLSAAPGGAGGRSDAAYTASVRLGRMTDTVIEVQDLARTYHAGDVDVHALRGVNLTIERGEFVAIMGSSGSGKSTMMAILGCLDRPTSGRYLFEGVDVAQLSEPELARIRSERIGFVFQSFNLLARTSALENTALPLFYSSGAPPRASERAERARRALELLGLGHRGGNTPAQLSGGEQQRVAIARALINSPSVLLADEPTGNLDTRNSHDIMQTLVRFNREHHVTIIVVTHESDIAAYADRVITMRDGAVVSDQRAASSAAAQTPASPPDGAPQTNGSAPIAGRLECVDPRHAYGVCVDDRRRRAAGARAQQDAIGVDDAGRVHRRRGVDRDGRGGSGRERSRAKNSSKASARTCSSWCRGHRRRAARAAASAARRR